MSKHVEWDTDFCGKDCVSEYHCLTCHRANELSTLKESLRILKRFEELLTAFESSPMAGMAMPRPKPQTSEMLQSTMPPVFPKLPGFPNVGR